MIYLENNDDRWPHIMPGSIDMIIVDPPFNTSESAEADGETEIVLPGRKNVRRDFGEWDKKYDPLDLIWSSAAALHPGGALVIKTGDKTIGMNRDFAAEEHSTTAAYLKWMYELKLIDSSSYYEAMDGLEILSESTAPKAFEYHNTVTWHKRNPMYRARLQGLIFSCEWIQIFVRRNHDGSHAPLSTFEWLGVPNMHNFFEAPICSGPERLYWHFIGGTVIPCTHSKECAHCQAGIERRSHPTQTPLSVWRWVFRRYSRPGMKVYDPYAGVGTTQIVAREFGCEWMGSEISYEYVTAGNMWSAGKWGSIDADKLVSHATCDPPW